MQPVIPTDFSIDFTGKNAIITGANKGIGQDIALRLAQAGANVALIARDEKALSETAAAIKKIGGDCLVLSCDLADLDQLAATTEKLNHHGHWDILINNAGVSYISDLLTTQVDTWQGMQDVNLRAVWLLSKAIAPQMIKRKSGKIINISSMTTFFGTAGAGAYAVSKAGLEQLTKTMAVEWGPHNLQINAVLPTMVLTEMVEKIWQQPENQALCEQIRNSIPLKRFAEKHEISNLVLFLASSAASFINGAIIPVDDGARWNG